MSVQILIKTVKEDFKPVFTQFQQRDLSVLMAFSGVFRLSEN